MKDGPAYRHLLWLISGSKALTGLLCDPSFLSEEEACSLIERLRKIEPSVELNLFKGVFGVDCKGGLSLEKPDCGLRFLQVFGIKSNSMRLLPLVAQLLKHPNARIRSKAAVLVGKMSRQYEWLEQTRNESDERVRANALEALWEPGIPERLRARLWESLQDESNRVIGNALLGLYRQGECGCIPLITAMTRHPEEKFRATAAWVMRETGDDRFRPYLLPLLNDASSLVKANAAQAVEKLEEARFAPLETLQLVIFSEEQGTRAWKTPSGNTAHKRGNENSELSASHILRVGVVSQQSSSLSTLLPTDFRVTVNSAPVEHYDISNEAPPHTVSIAFAVPAADAAGNSIRNKWRAFFSQFSGHKRHTDYWAFVECGGAQQTASGYNLRFLRNSLELEDFFRTQMQARKPIQFDASFDLLLTSPPFVPNGTQIKQGAAHVIIIDSDPSGRFQQERLEAIKQRACRGGFTIHVIAAKRDSVLAELAAATRGAFLVSQANVECWQRALTTLYAFLFSIYRIEFEAAPDYDAADAELKIQVQKGPLFGEIATACQPQPEMAAIG